MAAKFASAAADDLACPICFQFYVTPHEPKNLPKCSHMCCTMCLMKMAEGGLKTVKCPLCNMVSNLPEEGVDGLITSLTVRNLAEKHPEAIKQHKEYMQQELEQQENQMTGRLKEKGKTKQKILESIEQEVKEVEKVVESVMTQAQDMIKQIRELGQPKLNKTCQEMMQLEQQIKDIKQSQSTLEKIADGEFQTETDALVYQIGKLKSNDLTYGKEDHSTAKFVAQHIQLGRIVKPLKLEQVQELDAFECAFGIASNPNGTLAVSDTLANPPHVLVYKYTGDGYKKQYQFNMKKARPGLFTFFTRCDDQQNAFDIAVSTDDKYLVTIQSGGFEVYSPDGKYQKTLKVTTDPKQKVVSCSITTTRDGRVLVGSGIKGEEGEPYKYFITGLDTAGKILKTIPISIPPVHIAEICGMNVAVTSANHNKLCVYNLETGKKMLNLDIPMTLGVCHDEESGCLLIGRATEEDEDGNPVPGSCVIEQYCCITGKLVAVPAHGLDFSWAMTITQDRMLAVADMATVKVYKMK